MKYVLLLVTVASILTGCGASTKITKSWKEPGATIKEGTQEKTLVMSMVKDAVTRRMVEDNLVKRLGPHAVPSYTIFTDDMLANLTTEAFQDKVQRDSFKYVILMRLADVEKETSYVPGSTYGGYYGGYGRYYGYGMGMYTTPGYYTTDKNYFVETTVYSTQPDKLLWTGTTKTVNPSSVDKTVTKIADAVAYKMKEDKFLVK